MTKPPLEIQSATKLMVLCDDVFVEEGMSSAELSQLRAARDQAFRNVAHVFGTIRATPVVIFCRSAACKMNFGAPEAAAASQDLGFASASVLFADGTKAASAVVASGPVANTDRILAHELVHAEMKAFVPYDALPTWFNEGTATLIASEPPCNGPPPDDIDATLLSTKTRWERHLKTSRRTHDTYCAARSAVEKSLLPFETPERRGQALIKLMESVARGMTFEEALLAQRGDR